MLSMPFESPLTHTTPAPGSSGSAEKSDCTHVSCTCSPRGGQSAPATNGAGVGQAAESPIAPVIPLRPRQRVSAVPQDREAGMATAEYAIATLAAVAFAALLVAVLSSGDVRELLLALIRGALSFG
ncbi:DUF4244 domain-containing protein [Arthrobacter gallicola]|nr:DUF4244 domain-containing protein [Arthrobacter gallicola]